MIRLQGLVGEDITAAGVQAALAEETGAAVDIELFSPGGSPFEGAAVMNALDADPRPKLLTVTGLAASAATLPMLAGTTVAFAEGAVMMIHEPATIAIGNSAALAMTAEDMAKLSDVYAEVYARRTGNSLDDIRAWMAAETWLDGDEAVALGFADEVIKVENAPRMSLPASTSVRNGADLALAMFQAHVQPGET
jgi:ATP-dependent protease ClpP protease subunit